MADTIKYFAHIEAKAKCPKCGNPIYLNGPTANILCSYCLEDFTINETTGYFENPIIILNTKIVKKRAQYFIKRQ